MSDEEREIYRRDLGGGRAMVVRVIGDRLDIRVWVESDRYTGPTKQGIRIDLEVARDLAVLLAGDPAGTS